MEQTSKKGQLVRRFEGGFNRQPVAVLVGYCVCEKEKEIRRLTQARVRDYVVIIYTGREPMGYERRLQ